MSTEDTLEKIASQIRNCTECKLHLSRKNAVPGEGPAEAELMFIGEAPGFHENEQGRPFVGAAGKFLDELLLSIGLDRNRVFIGNVIKCRPPGNRDPQADEMEACEKFLARQIEIINPKVIITLGRFSMARYIPNVRISDVHGQARWVNGRLVVAMYHPAAALHQPSLRSVVAQDFSKLPGYVEQAQKAETLPEPPPAPEQLSLF